MKHQNKGRTLKRKKDQRKALLRILVRELITNGKIKTTEAKAKELRGCFDRLVGFAKKGNLAGDRKLYSELQSQILVKKMKEELKSRFESRKSGYTRLTKIGRRKGDGASVIQIEII